VSSLALGPSIGSLFLAKSTSAALVTADSGVEEALRTAATTDSLTRLANNRSAFRARAQSMLDLAQQRCQFVAMVMFDLDRFDQ